MIGAVWNPDVIAFTFHESREGYVSFKLHPNSFGTLIIFTALLLRENHDFPSSGFQNKTSFLFETRQPRTHVRVLG